MMMLDRSLKFVFVALLVMLPGASSWAQAAGANISGVVKDPSNAGIGGAQVTATNTATKAAVTGTTDKDGNYTLAVPAGSYSVTASLAGFKKVTQSAELGEGASVKLDFALDAELTQEITVTAMKREESVQDVPFSVAAPTEQELQDRGAQDLEGVAANVGGFSVQNLGPGQSQVSMRGVSAGQIVRDQPGVKEQVGIYLDESAVSLSLFTPDLDLVDVNHVEVLRGPQGTLFGAGSMSGTVRYITNQPELGRTEGSVEAGAHAIDGGSAGASGKLVYNLPVGEKAAARVAAYYTHTGGYIDAIQPDLSVNDNVNDSDRIGVRAAIKFAASDKLTITPRFVYQGVTADGINRFDAFNILANPYTTTRPAVDIGEDEQFTQRQEDYDDDFALGDLNITYDLGGMTLTSITSYMYRDILVTRDATTLAASITGGSVGLPEPVYTLTAPLFDATTAKVFTEEVRLAGGAADLNWLVGAFYTHLTRDYGQNAFVAGFTEMTGIPTEGLLAPEDSLFFSQLGYDLDQFAIFGEATYDLSDRFSVTGGLRYYNFSEDKTQIFDGIFGNDNNGTELVEQPGSTEADGLAPRAILSYKLTDNSMVNAQISRGFRLGGVNDPLNVPLCTPSDLETFGGHEVWEDETVWNYELGYKSRVLSGKGTFNVSAYYMDISDLQATVTAGSCSSRVIFNVPDSRSTGLEVEFGAAPNSNLDFNLSGNFNSSELQSTLTSTDSAGNVTVVSGIEEGERLPSVPEVQLAAAATYQWEMRPEWLTYVAGTYQYTGSRFTQVGDQNLGVLNMNSFGENTIGGPLTANTFTYDPELPAYSNVNFRVGVRRLKWDVSLYVNNLTDERAFLSFDRERGTLARIGFLTNQPRTFGLTTRYNF